MFPVYINKKKFLLSNSCSIAELIDFLGINTNSVIIEYNKLVLPSLFWTTTKLSSYDSLIFATVVGGG